MDAGQTPNLDQSGSSQPFSANAFMQRVVADLQRQPALDLARIQQEALRDLQQVPKVDAPQIVIPQIDFQKAMADYAAHLRQSLSDMNWAEFVRASLRGLNRAVTSGLTAVGKAFEEAQQREIWFLVEKTDLKSALTLLALDRVNKDRTVAVLEAAVEDEGYLDWLIEKIRKAEGLSGPQRERLVNGLRDLKSPGEHWTAPRDALHLAVEGMLWDLASAEGVIDDHQRLITSGRWRRPKARQAANLLGAEDGLELDEPLRRFLITRVVDPASHPVRHARSSEFNRRYALYSLVGLLGLVDRQSGEPWALRSLTKQMKGPLELEKADLQPELASGELKLSSAAKN